MAEGPLPAPGKTHFFQKGGPQISWQPDRSVVQAKPVGGLLLHAAGHAVAGRERLRGGARARPVCRGR